MGVLPLDRQNAYRERYKRLDPGWRTSGERLEELIARRVSPDSSVLDVGSGRGGPIETLYGAVRLAVGVDPDVASLRERRRPLPVSCALAESLPFADERFDLALGIWLLEHLPNPEAALAEIRRVLRPGGHFLFITPNAEHPLLRMNRVLHARPALQRRLVWWLYRRQEDDIFHAWYRANTLARLRDLAGAVELRVDSLTAIKDPTYLAFGELLFRASALFERALPQEWGVHIVGDLVRDHRRA